MGQDAHDLHSTLKSISAGSTSREGGLLFSLIPGLHLSVFYTVRGENSKI